MENNSNRTDEKSLHVSEDEQDIETDMEDEWDEWDEDEQSESPPVAQRKWIRNTIIFLLVAALIGNTLAFWPQIYNTTTLPFLFKSKELSNQEEIQGYKEAVVSVSSDKGKGTGFHISGGYIVTNFHVIDDNAYTLVKFPDNDRVYKAELAGSDPDLDIALLKVDMGGQELPFIEIEREKQQWEPGEHVYVIGNPLYFTQIANEGKILGMVPVQGREKPAMALDAPVFNGNSGSPVINEYGKAIAVIYATAEISHQDKIVQAGLAVPLDDLDNLLRDLMP
ncbi:S1-C subfamily serine protease [Paenibacillus sp. DS2015]|uniref:S1 family peptidase n=1 Tax=Paenibacillus sp. DS2015 TaxID=3373917 RepID=UPI003D2212E9